tara:strand:- start:4147 stop:4401 length:255 start_codon:yes stop_codon:yes gene_type:complete
MPSKYESKIFITNELYTKDDSNKLGNNLSIKNIKSKNLTIAIIIPIIIFANPFILGTYKPKKKFTNGRPAHANNPIKTLYIEYA